MNSRKGITKLFLHLFIQLVFLRHVMSTFVRHSPPLPPQASHQPHFLESDSCHVAAPFIAQEGKLLRSLPSFKSSGAHLVFRGLPAPHMTPKPSPTQSSSAPPVRTPHPALLQAPHPADVASRLSFPDASFLSRLFPLVRLCSLPRLPVSLLFFF